MEVVDHIKHAVNFDVVENEQTGEHVIIYSGGYLYRFGNIFTVRAWKNAY